MPDTVPRSLSLPDVSSQDRSLQDLSLRHLPDGFVDLTGCAALSIDLRYATANNFVGRGVYGGFDRLILHAIAAGKLLAAAAVLSHKRPDLRLLVLDGLRPNRVQRVFWDLVHGTANQKYVGDPAIGSVHGFGLAVDATLAAAAGAELDMGTPFDDFSALAEPAREAGFLADGRLSATQMANRTLLRGVMSAAGFLPIPVEWWHFDALPPDVVRREFRLIE